MASKLVVGDKSVADAEDVFSSENNCVVFYEIHVAKYQDLNFGEQYVGKIRNIGAAAVHRMAMVNLNKSKETTPTKVGKPS